MNNIESLSGKELLNELYETVNSQLAFLRKKEIRNASKLRKKAEILSERIGQLRLLDKEEFNDNVKILRKKYSELGMAISLLHQDCAKDIQKINLGKKTLTKYKKYI